MKQPIAKSMNGAITMIEQLADGVSTYPTLGVTHNTQPVLMAKRQEAITARNNYEVSKQSLRIVRQALEQTRLQARAMIMLSRDILKPNFGNEFNGDWTVVGFAESLETPDDVDDLAIQMEAFETFFAANPTLEITSKNITGTYAEMLHMQLVEGRKAVNDKETETAQLMELRDAKFDEMRKRIRFTIDELNGILGPLDPRWTAFGLNIPGADETPDQVVNVSAILIGPNAVALKWDASARATYYRVWFKVHGAEGDYAAAGSPADLDFTLENLPAASTIDIVVSAVNSGGESAVSQVITITTH